MKRIIAPLLIVFLIGCKTSDVYLRIQHPAEISLQPDLKKIVLINRTKAKDKTFETIEGILTGEGIGGDKSNIQECFRGMNSVLTTTSRFQLINGTEVITTDNAFANGLPEPLDWQQAEALATKYQADAVMTLEYFDTDFIVTNGKKDKVETDKDGKKITQTVVWARGVGQVKAGFRIYDVKRKNIAYQDIINYSKNWESTAGSLVEALSQLIGNDQAMRASSYQSGEEFACKITPLFTSEQREFYRKGNKIIERGARLAQVNDWNGAYNAWLKGINDSDEKINGRIHYNLAIASEVLGDLSKAREWANKSYTIFSNKKSRYYSAQIERRMNAEEVLKEQYGK